MKAALVYDRVNKWGGAERVLLTLHEMFPDAPLYTSVYNPKKAEWAKVFPEVITSFVQNISLAKDNHEHFPYLMPLAFESFSFDDYDLVISITSEYAKGIIAKPGTKHICYMLTPTRYLWSGYDDYFKGQPFKVVINPIVKYLKSWDRIAANRPDKIISISTEVKKRVKKYYKRDSEVIYPPTDLSKFHITNSRLQTNAKSKSPNYNLGEYYLVVSRLVSYKKVDIAIRTFNITGKKLAIVGVGRDESKLRKTAKGNILFIKHLTDEELTNYYKNAKALIFPQNEDFGLVAVEAQACGTPVIAFKSGGALDTVLDGETGVLFEKQNVQSLMSAIKKFDTIHFNKDKIRKNAERFSEINFRNEFILAIQNA
jgi:glycosyltransferase involved in cell wall biosynthesis